MALGLIPKHCMQSSALSSNKITLEQDGNALFTICLVML